MPNKWKHGLILLMAVVTIPLTVPAELPLQAPAWTPAPVCVLFCGTPDLKVPKNSLDIKR
jgi:hypothetical protein